VRADDGRLAAESGFEDVVTSPAVEGAADEDEVGEGVEGGEFAEGVDEEGGRAVEGAGLGFRSCWGQSTSAGLLLWFGWA